MTTIINRVVANLNDKTDAALSQLAGLEREVASAIAFAEQHAQDRINNAVANLDGTVANSLASFETRLATMAADALTRAVDGLAARLEPVAAPAATTEPTPYIPTFEEIEAEGDDWREEMDADEQPQAQELDQVAPSEPDQHEQPSTPAPDINSPEWLAEVNRRLDEQAARDREADTTTPEPVQAQEAETMPISVTAAQLLATEQPGILDDDDTDDDAETATEGIATTCSLDGLHEKRGLTRSKQCRVK